MHKSDPCARTHAHAQTATTVQACRWCGRTGPVVSLGSDVALDYETILKVSNLDIAVYPPVTSEHYICYECSIWESAIEERCHHLFGVCIDAVRQAAMKRYLDQNRWLSVADLNEIARKHNISYIR